MQSNSTKYENPYDKHLGYRSVFQNVGPRFYIRTRYMLKYFHPAPDKIIDIGCGDGFTLSVLRKKGIVADGIDGSAKAIEKCRTNLREYPGRIECCFIEEFDSPQKYDLLLCGEVLEHIEDDVSFLENINRLANENAVLILTVPLDMQLWSKSDEQAGHFRRYSKQEILEKVEESGFRVEKYLIWGWPLVRYLMPFIRSQQTKMMGVDLENKSQKKNLLSKFKFVFRLFKYVFLFDGLFNFTEKGVGIVIRARKKE